MEIGSFDTCLRHIYAVSDEAGLVICTWPKGERPGFAFKFCDEVWGGTEYQVASHMIYEGMANEGLAIAMGTRKRHRGDRRNPWDEFECGHHCSRSMASYGLLLGLSGFSFSSPEKRFSFTPEIYREKFKVFFSTASGWGLYSQKITLAKVDVTLELKYGSLSLTRLDLPLGDFSKPEVRETLNGKESKAQLKREKDRLVVLLDSVLVKEGQKLRVIQIRGKNTMEIR